MPFFATDTEYTSFSKALTVYTQKTTKYSHTEQTLKDGNLSGVVQSCEILLQHKSDIVQRLFY